MDSKSGEYLKNLTASAGKKLFGYSRNLRQRATEPEEVLWEYLRNRKLNGRKFRRQHPILYYIADFYCHELRLVIEVDGEIHNTPQSRRYDRRRDSQLKDAGITTIRFTNAEVLNNLSGVLGILKAKIPRV